MNEEQLKKSLSKAIEEFQKNRASILKMAYDDGGQTAVEEIETQFDKLDYLYHNILRGELDKNSGYYEKLVQVSNDEAQKLTKSIETLNDINSLSESLSSLLSAVVKIVSAV